MSLLAFQLAGLRVTGSIGKGAVLVGVAGFCGLLGPWSGRRRDRASMRGRLQLGCVVGALALSGMGACVRWSGPYLVLVVLAVVQGSSLSGMWAGFRALLVQVASQERLRQAHFVESLMVEVSFVVGPLLVMVITGSIGVAGALVAMAVAELVAAVLLVGVPDLRGARRAATGRPAGLQGDVRSAVLVVSAFAFMLGLGFSMVEANVPSRMAPYGLAAGSAGVYMAVLAGGSCIGGLVVIFRPLRQGRSRHQAALLFGLLGLLGLPSALARSPSEYMAALSINSLALVPLNGLGSAEIERRVGADSRGEAFGWFNAAMRLGGGTGATLDGVLLAVMRPGDIPLVACGVFGCMPVVLLATGLGRAQRAGPGTQQSKTSRHSRPTSSI